jgi:hypothetical protein
MLEQGGREPVEGVLARRRFALLDAPCDVR